METSNLEIGMIGQETMTEILTSETKTMTSETSITKTDPEIKIEILTSKRGKSSGEIQTPSQRKKRGRASAQ